MDNKKIALGLIKPRNKTKQAKKKGGMLFHIRWREPHTRNI